MLRDYGKVKAKGAIKLDIDEPRSDEAALEVDCVVRNIAFSKKEFLATEDLASHRRDVEIFVDNLITLDKAAIDEPSNAPPLALGL